MTAIGFVALAIGMLMFDSGRATNEDDIALGGAIAVIVGLALTTAGIAAKLWEVMP